MPLWQILSEIPRETGYTVCAVLPFLRNLSDTWRAILAVGGIFLAGMGAMGVIQTSQRIPAQLERQDDRIEVLETANARMNAQNDTITVQLETVICILERQASDTTRAGALETCRPSLPWRIPDGP